MQTLGYCGKNIVPKANQQEHEILAPIDCIGIFCFCLILYIPVNNF